MHDLLRLFFIASAAIGQTAFILLYASFPWWQKFLGRALFAKAMALALLADVAIAGQVWDWPHEHETFTVLYGLLSFGIWFQFFAFLRVRVQRRQDQVIAEEEIEGVVSDDRW